MKPFEAKKYTIPKLIGISEKTVEEHLKLYGGYVKHANLIREHIEVLAKESEKFAYELAELQRRFSFEFGGMKNHEYYFAALEGGSTTLSPESMFSKTLAREWGSAEHFVDHFKAIALTRGIGWAKLVYDPQEKTLLTAWIDEQHLGQLPDTTTILALDMWEHSFVADYQPSGKKQYVEDFFKNLNWSVIEKNYETAVARP